MSNDQREPIEWIELDLDFCTRTWGVAPCTAVLSSQFPAKCFNTFTTCADKPNYNKGVITYKLVMPRSNYPKGETTFPCLSRVSNRSATANIAGSDDELFPLGRRGKITADLVDFPYHDRFCDKYQSERVSGAAQFSGVGYDPKAFGTFWSKLHARNPNYANRPMRHCTGFLDGGVLVTDTVRHYIITEIKRDTSGGGVKIEGKDILKLADDDRAVAPLQSRGFLSKNISADNNITFDLLPKGIGGEYANEGFASIGSEIVSYTRVGRTITLTGRGLSGTTASEHDVNDTFQQTFSPRLDRIDNVIRDLLLLAGIPSGFIPFADWQAEVSRWAPTLKLTADITEPTGVAKLIGELAILGITIWWDEIAQEIKLLVNRPVDQDVVKPISDKNNILKSELEDRDKDRLTEVLFNTVQIDPNNGVSEDNFLRGTLIVDVDAKLPENYGDTRIKKIYCRWLNHGDDATVRILSLRLLNRFKTQPVRYVVEVDYRDDVEIADVIELTSDVITSPTGLPEPQLTQVVKREDVDAGHTLKMTLQKFQFNERYAFFTENTRPVYNSSSAAQKERGAYWADATLIFDDGTEAYKFA